MRTLLDGEPRRATECMAENGVTVIACDESASEGENLMLSAHPIFVHGSVNLTLDEATDLIDHLRSVTGSRALELKSRTVVAPRHRAALLDALPSLAGRGNIYFVDKSYFLAAKMIALLPAELGERNGVDVHLSGLGRHLTNILHRKGPASIGSLQWRTLLTSFNSVVRSYLREGSTPVSVQPFFAALANARKNCRDIQVAAILEEIWEARHLALEYEGAGVDAFRELDPMFPSLATVAMTWRMRLGDVPFEFLADNYSGLTEPVRKAIIDAAQHPPTLAHVTLPRSDLRAIHLIDSKLDARVQAADILAGIGREVARLAMAGTFDDELQNSVHQMLDFNVMSSSESPLDVLVERAPLSYRETWLIEEGT